MSDRLLREAAPPAIALLLAIATFGVLLSGSVGSGRCRRHICPSTASRMATARARPWPSSATSTATAKDDYAVGLPYADANGSDSGIVYVFLGPGVAAPRHSPWPRRSFRIVGHARRAARVQRRRRRCQRRRAGRHRDRRTDGRPAEQERRRRRLLRVRLGAPGRPRYDGALPSPATPTAPNPAPPSPFGSRYDGFQQELAYGHVRGLAGDVNGDGVRRHRSGAPDADLHRPAAAAWRCSTASPTASTSRSPTYGSNGIPLLPRRLSDARQPARRRERGARTRHDRRRLGPTSRWRAAGRSWRDAAARLGLDHQRAPAADRRGLHPGMNPGRELPVDQASTASTPAQGYRIDGAVAGEGIGSSLAAVGDQDGDGRPDLAIGASAASPDGRMHAGEVVVDGGPSRRGRVRHAASALEHIAGALGWRRFGASSPRPGDIDGDRRIDLLVGAPGEASSAGAAYFVRGQPRGRARIWRRARTSPHRSRGRRARRRAAPSRLGPAMRWSPRRAAMAGRVRSSA